MPLQLFFNKFSPKRAPTRKTSSQSSLHRDLDPVQKEEEFGVDFEDIRMKLGNSEAVFDDGHWITSSESGPGKEITTLRKQNKNLVEENNLLKLKVELLLDMLSQTTAESHLQSNEIDQLRKRTRKMTT